MTNRLRICLLVAHPADRAECVRVLAELCTVFVLDDRYDLEGPIDGDLLVAELDRTDPDHLSALARCRRNNPDLPLLLLSRNVDADLTAELLKLLGDDLLSLPLLRSQELRLKAERLLLGKEGPALLRPCLHALFAGGESGGPERRRVFRAQVPKDFLATVYVRGGARPITARLVDLAVASGKWPGAIRIALPRKTAQAIVHERLLPSWGRGARLQLVLRLQGLDQDVYLRGRILRLPRPKHPNSFPVVVRYHASDPQDEERMVLFWTNCQLHGRMLAKARDAA